MHSWAQIEAEKAFSSATRARRRASVARRLRGDRGACGQLPVHDETALRSGSATGLGLREIPLEAISGTVEPNRAAQFDREFRPAGRRVRAGRASGWPRSAGRCCRRSRSSRSATRTRSATAITASRWPGRGARSRSTRSSARPSTAGHARDAGAWEAAAHDPRAPLALEPHTHAVRRLHGPPARRPAHHRRAPRQRPHARGARRRRRRGQVGTDRDVRRRRPHAGTADARARRRRCPSRARAHRHAHARRVGDGDRRALRRGGPAARHHDGAHRQPRDRQRPRARRHPLDARGGQPPPAQGAPGGPVLRAGAARLRGRRGDDHARRHPRGAAAGRASPAWGR